MRTLRANWRVRVARIGRRSGRPAKRVIGRLQLEWLEPRRVLASGYPGADGLATAEGEADVTVAEVRAVASPTHRLEVTFSQPMQIAPLLADGSILSAVSVDHWASGPLALSANDFRYDELAQRLTWSPSQPLMPGYYALQLHGQRLQDAAGQPLRGGTGGLAFHLPDFAAAAEVVADGTAIQVESYSVPSLADWNGDDLLDLLVGEETAAGQGKVRAQLARSQPFVGDVDADGLPDLLVGAGDGLVRLYRALSWPSPQDLSGPTGSPGEVYQYQFQVMPPLGKT